MTIDRVGSSPAPTHSGDHHEHSAARRDRPAHRRLTDRPAHSEVSFTVRHLMTRVRGSFASFGGTITVGDDPTRSSVRAEIDTDTRPTAHFESATVRIQENGRYSVEGFMTIRNESRPATLDLALLGVADDPWGGTRAGFRASTRPEGVRTRKCPRPGPAGRVRPAGAVGRELWVPAAHADSSSGWR
ncbi:YceI family protein [Streptomyces sp. HC307]|uniref:YceI family protein n=1 Tax=Streptomyces flavusporus TaxID=3385496 RepID=UPI0039175F0A